MSFFPAVQGFFLGISMIMAIGAQNAWIIKQGVARNHHIPVAVLCMTCDIILIVLGVYGAGTLVSESSVVLSIVTIGGVLFLGWYGALSLRSALTPAGSLDISGEKKSSLKKVLLATLAITLLNPHVYLDTIVVLGSLGGQYEGRDKLAFAVGTVLASVTWFLGLASGAAKLAPVLSRPRVRQGIDLLVCIIMWAIAVSLLVSWLKR